MGTEEVKILAKYFSMKENAVSNCFYKAKMQSRDTRIGEKEKINGMSREGEKEGRENKVKKK